MQLWDMCSHASTTVRILLRYGSPNILAYMSLNGMSKTDHKINSEIVRVLFDMKERVKKYIAKIKSA